MRRKLTLAPGAKTRWQLSVEYRSKHGRWPSSRYWEALREKAGIRQGLEPLWHSKPDLYWDLEEVAKATRLRVHELEAGAVALGLRPPGTEHFLELIPRRGEGGEDCLQRLLMYCWAERGRRSEK